jgi:hypothetical protein
LHSELAGQFPADDGLSGAHESEQNNISHHHTIRRSAGPSGSGQAGIFTL